MLARGRPTKAANPSWTLVELVEGVDTVLCDIAALANFAVIERSQHRLPFDLNARVADHRIS